MTQQLTLTRRSLIAAAAAGVATAAVGAKARADVRAPVAMASYAALTSSPIFYVAHRGSGCEWPEMTRYAYRKASEVPGVRALEVSVRLSSDGVLVCSHDPDTARLTGVDLTIAEEKWSRLSQLWVSARETVEPDQPSRKFSRLDDVLDLVADNFVLFVEPKVSAADEPLLERMAALGHPERVVWKQPINSQYFLRAKEHGFATWGYVLDEPSHTGANLAAYAASDAVDLLGAPGSELDEFVAAVVAAADANGKRTMMWAVRTPVQRARALALGCAGIMTPAIGTLLRTPLA